jgi:hypothetical protein
MPTDSDNNPVPVLRLNDNKAHQITSSPTSARNSLAFADSTRVVSLYATQAVFVRFGDSSVTATSADHYFPAGIYYDVSIGGEKTGHASHLAVISAGTNGTVYVSEKA